jgi:hypothetical protein
VQKQKAQVRRLTMIKSPFQWVAGQPAYLQVQVIQHPVDHNASNRDVEPKEGVSSERFSCGCAYRKLRLVLQGFLQANVTMLHACLRSPPSLNFDWMLLILSLLASDDIFANHS